MGFRSKIMTIEIIRARESYDHIGDNTGRAHKIGEKIRNEIAKIPIYTYSSPSSTGIAITMSKVGNDFRFKKLSATYGISAISSNELITYSLDKQPLHAKATLTSAAASTPVSLIDNSDIIGRKAYLVSFHGKVNGATAWSGGTMSKIIVRDRNGNLFFEIPISVLTANAPLLMDMPTATYGDRFLIGNGSDEGVGLEMVADGTAGAGSDLVMNIFAYRGI